MVVLRKNLKAPWSIKMTQGVQDTIFHWTTNFLVV